VKDCGLHTACRAEERGFKAFSQAGALDLWGSDAVGPNSICRVQVFLQFLLDAEAYTWFAKLIVAGELLVGIGLLLGALTGIAAVFGAFMNWNFMLAGTASTNPILGLIAIGLVIAWKIAGWWGLDRILLPALGAPWQRGRLFGGEALVSDERPEPRMVLVERWFWVLLGVGVSPVCTLSTIRDRPNTRARCCWGPGRAYGSRLVQHYQVAGGE
jgi:uncharacterized membrane protein YphA (DoxX/SURF4 family)